MIGILATLKVQPDKTAEFEAAFAEAIIKVRADEPGNLVYQLVKSRSEPGVYKMMELYKDEAATAAHRETAHFKALGPKLGPCLAAPPEIEILDGV